MFVLRDRRCCSFLERMRDSHIISPQYSLLLELDRNSLAVGGENISRRKATRFQIMRSEFRACAICRLNVLLVLSQIQDSSNPGAIVSISSH